MLKRHRVTDITQQNDNSSASGPIDKFTVPGTFPAAKSKFNPEEYKKILILWMVKHNISFIQVENREFQNLQTYGQSLGAK